MSATTDWAAGFTDKFKSVTGDAFGRVGSAVKGFGAPGSSYVLPVIIAIIAIAAIVAVIFMAIQLNTNKPAKLLKGPVDLYEPTSVVVVDRPTVKASMQATYTLCFYLRIDAVPDMRASATPLLTWAGIWDLGYNAAKEELVWRFNESPDSALLGSSEPVIVRPVPLQRWTQVAVTFEGRSADFYVNGQLVQSKSLTNVPPSANSSVTIVPKGALGQIAYVQLWSRRLTMNELGGNYTDTSDSQGRPFIGPGFLSAIKGIKVPNLFCPSGNCGGSTPTASASQTWEFPYA